MRAIAFIDTEVSMQGHNLLDIGAIKLNGASFHSASLENLQQFLNEVNFVCGHNIFLHDLQYIKKALLEAAIPTTHIIDTLYLSPLLFPKEPYHALLKDDKLQSEERNNPLNDSMKARDLFLDEVAAFRALSPTLQRIYYTLLHDTDGFHAFFRYLNYDKASDDIEEEIRLYFQGQLCANTNLSNLINSQPIELAYSLALINANSRYSITPPWVLKNFPRVEQVLYILRNKQCLTSCAYCDEALNIHSGLKRYFGYDRFRTYAGKPLQEMAVQAAVDNKSLLAIFPTGGGKSLTFQIPALMSGTNVKGLTVVLSPLQSLMKDQVDNLEKAGITDAVTINGLLDPIERAQSFARVENGTASILYIAPESLRSKSIERLLLGRNVVRFVIDEAHCFSAWGQDFRVDYLYIGDFIKSLQKRKNMTEHIPVSCFTATAKQKVIEDIRQYFLDKLDLELEVYSSNATRTNLRYQVIARDSEEEKYNTIRDLLEHNDSPTIIYVSRTRKARELAQRLSTDGYEALAYYGKMEKQEKSVNQDAFIQGNVRIMVATSAFGMGVDKKDVGMVIHYDISDSLENYVQEAGRAGRDETISADCYVLYNDEDLSKHFTLLNQTKITIQEIQQVWRAIKDLTKFRSKVSQSALEIARKAGWDSNISEMETRVTTAIAALEEAGYVKREQNMPKVYANSILANNAREAIEKIQNSHRFDEKQKTQATRIIKKLFSTRSKKHINEEIAEARVDYISDHLGIAKFEVIQIIQLLRDEKILADAKDLVAAIKKKDNVNRTLHIAAKYWGIERFLLSTIHSFDEIINTKQWNEIAEEQGIKDVTTSTIKTILNYWAIKGWAKQKADRFSKNHIHVHLLYDKDILLTKFEKRHELALFIIEYLFILSQNDTLLENSNVDEVQVEFSIMEIKQAFERRASLFTLQASTEEIEDALFYLSRIEALKIEGGFMVIYNALTIERTELDNKRGYKREDYQKLQRFYENKVQQIHIVGEYARKMIEDYKVALQFVDDYFQLLYSTFIRKYFKGSRQEEIRRNITPTKFKQLFGELSTTQLNIINDKQSRYIVVAAGPGSGKTRILVHKLASLLLMEDVKEEQLLMLTFSRAAVTEFKKRLYRLIGGAAHFIEIKTFHSYCFDLLDRVGTIERSDAIIVEAIARIQSGEVEVSKITKSVLVIDEAQDMDANEFALIRTLMEHNENMRVLVVGDDDQNIFAFRGSSSQYLKMIMELENATTYELIENYRSRQNLVHYANQFVRRIPHRLKKTPIQAVQHENGSITLIRYRHRRFLVPLVQSIMEAPFVGSTCVLTKTNDEALQITGLLLKNGVLAKLIQSNESFNLYNLVELRYFLNKLATTEDVYTISEEAWITAKKTLSATYAKSSNLEVCLRLLADFEATSPKTKYRSDLEIFIRESNLEDFFGGSEETIYVSTIHKAKGREFEHVYVLLDSFDSTTDEAKRQLYVAMTRAKQSLSIHYNGNYLHGIKAEDLHVFEDERPYEEPEHIAFQLTYRDVYLDAFREYQIAISKLLAGEELIVDSKGCLDRTGAYVLTFSKQTVQTIADLQRKNYVPTSAKIRFILYWRKEEEEYELRIILPELFFRYTPPPPL